MSTYPDAVTSSASSERLIGRVKWFNNKAGYGFITVTDGSRSGSDVFVHHSAIDVLNQQYKYLVQGEYVEFSLSSTSTGAHEFQASTVVGIKGGKLMCETRREFKIARNSYKTTSTTDSDAPVEEPVRREPRQRAAPKQEASVTRESPVPRARGEGPRDGEKKEWTLVKGARTGPTSSGRGRGRPPRSTNNEAK
jgi:CspA family cold shock protein